MTSEHIIRERGELAELMRSRDWSRTPLGAPEAWPSNLRTVLRLMLSSRYAMWMGWGPELTFFYNDSYRQQTLGAKHPWALGRPTAEVWAEIWETLWPRIEHVLATGEATWDEGLLLFLERSGFPEETYHTFSYSPLPGEGDRPAGLFCVVIEETERVIGERRLALLHEFAALLSQTKSTAEVLEAARRSLSADARDVPFSLVYFFDPDGPRARLVSATGLAADHPAVPALAALDATAPWALGHVWSQSAPAVVTLDPGVRWPHGAWRVPPTHALVVPIAQQGHGAPAGAFVAAINPHRPLDEAMRSFVGLLVGQLAAGLGNARAYEGERRRAEALAEIDRVKTAFFSNVSHEFRTPLTLMLGPTEDALASPERALRGADLEAVHRNELRLLKLVNALLDFSRIEAGRAHAAREATDLGAFTADLASAFRSAIERAGLRFDVTCELPDEPVFVDRGMWEKIVLNLLSNALKFTFDGAITVSLRAAGDRVELAVGDTGVGIAAAEVPHLFERFHRVEGARSRTHEGSGIGLALVHELVRLHGGTIRVDSEPGRGTTFTVSVPRGRAHLPDEPVAAASPGASTLASAAPYVAEALRWLASDDPSGEREGRISGGLDQGPDGRAAHIVLADDNPDMREYVSRLLRQRWSVEAVADGVAALAAARRRAPDLVLTDVMMPGLDGFGLLRALRDDPATAAVPVVMLSARAGDEARSEGLESGADDYLVKPFSARELMARVGTLLQLAALRRVAEVERARLFELFMQAPVAIAVLQGTALRYVVANPAYCEIVGRDAVVGRDFADVFPELVGEPVYEVFRGAYERGERARFAEYEVRLRRRGVLAPAYFDYVIEPMRELGEVVGLMVVASEVTAQVTARRRVDGLRAAAEDASRAKDEFLNTLSHELRTPLNAIIGWSTLLRSGSVPAEQRPKALETVERNARIQARLIEDMLDLSRIEQGKFVLSVGPVELVRVVDAAIEAVRPAAEAKGIRLQPVLDSHAAIVGDADRLQQIVWNLLSNAIKFTPKGGRVQVRLRREQSYVELVVADTGQGITAEFLPHAFDRFRQGDASFARRAGGLGLGLAIVRSLVELHGGDVRAQSDGPGEGATFTVRLPLAPLRSDRASPVAPEPDLPQRADFECPPALRGKRVLVVDDEPETRELLRFVIGQCECEVETAGGGFEALSALDRMTFDAMVSDVGMPDMDGFELVRRVRARPASAQGHLPAVALTAYARVEDRTRSLREGFDMHLAKPIEPGELLAVLAALVSDRRRG
ncbi:MAG: ATP-binding protein [Deltaproteobacteria bacterium]|nr:ATP-binding protein [Deltaproteobacteria bacterium]